MSDEPVKVLRAGSQNKSRYCDPSELPERRSEPSKPVVTLDPNFEEIYNTMPASSVRQKYESDQQFKAQVDLLLAGGGAL
jgi:hypothetical protein